MSSVEDLRSLSQNSTRVVDSDKGWWFIKIFVHNKEG